MVGKANRLTIFLSKRRRWIQGAAGIGLYALNVLADLSLGWILLIGVAFGVVFGKAFCRWVCPIGFIMELLTSKGDDRLRSMYQYHKMGCPIAWVSGALNRFSLLRLRRSAATCTSCGLCDKACYMPALDPERFSFFNIDKQRPGDAYACSRCLFCVSACPNGSLKYAPVLPWQKS